MKYSKILALYCLSFFAMNAQAGSFALNARYVIENSWPTGYQVTVTLNNPTANPTSTWTSTFTLGQGQSISNLWNGILKINGQSVTAINPAWNGGGIIPRNSSTTFGFIVNNPQGSTPGLNNLQAVANGSSTPTLPIPTAPTLNPISLNGSSYTVSWSTSANAASYILQRATTSNFSNGTTVAQGAITSQTFNNQPIGTYFYRVSAANATGISPYSATQSVTVTQAPPQPTGKLIESYWESWNSSDPISAIVNMHVDIINISFANFVTTGTHKFIVSGVEAPQATIAQLVTLAHNAGKKVKIAVGGATYPLVPQLKTTEDAVGMAQAIALYIQENNLDGVDLDIEDYPAPALQVSLIQNLRQLLGANKLISYTPKSPASTTFPYNQVIASAHQYLDAILIMAYDYAPGYNNQQDALALIAMGVPASKISIGLMPGYDDLGVMTSIADIIATAEFAEQKGLQGIMFWDLNRDLSNVTGLGASAATNAAWNVFNS